MIEYLREENRVLREQLGERRLWLTDDQRRRLAAKAKGLGGKLFAEVATIVTPETLLRWHQRLIAQKYDGSGNRGPGRPRTAGRDRGPGCSGQKKTGIGERLILFGESSLRTAVQNVMAHYHSERNDQGLGNRLIQPESDHLVNTGAVERRECLGGMLNYYYRAVA